MDSVFVYYVQRHPILISRRTYLPSILYVCQRFVGYIFNQKHSVGNYSVVYIKNRTSPHVRVTLQVHVETYN